jgi:hypothetical protein
MEAAHVNVLEVEASADRNIGAEFQRLRQAPAVRDLARDPPARPPLHAPESAAYRPGLRAAPRAVVGWPHGYEPQAFLALYSSSVVGNAIPFRNEHPVRLMGGLERTRREDQNVGGPFLTLVTIGSHPRLAGSPLSEDMLRRSMRPAASFR